MWIAIGLILIVFGAAYRLLIIGKEAEDHKGRHFYEHQPSHKEYEEMERGMRPHKRLAVLIIIVGFLPIIVKIFKLFF